MRISPPRLAQRFFSWYCRNQLRDSILGDLDERFYQNMKNYGVKRAKLMYWVDVLCFINRFTLKRGKHVHANNYYSTSMIKNYLISSLRFLRRNVGYTLINSFGLIVGFTSFFLIILFVDHQLSFDEFHENKENIYRVNFSFQDNSGNVTTLVNSPPALAGGVAGEFPELDEISKMRYAGNCLLSNGDTQFYEDHGYYADSLFLETLAFKLDAGDQSTVLDEPNSIVISEALALKYFNDPNPIGSTLLFNNSIPLQVTGILSEIPTNSHLNFNFLISFPTYTIPEGYASDLTSWSWLGFLTYVELKEGTDPAQFEDKMVQFFKELDPENPNPPLPAVQKLSDIYLGSSGMADDLSSNIRTGSQSSVNALLTISLLILVIAGFNFSNLTSAIAMTRGKASGIRKVLGASRGGIVSQMLSESTILTLFCLIFSFALVLLLFPTLARILDWEFSLGLVEIGKMVLLGTVVGTLLTIISSFFPALALARFNIIQSLKGSLNMGATSQGHLKNVLVTTQFAISIGLIATTIIMAKQIGFLKNKNTGYHAENVVLIEMLPEDLSSHFETFKDLMVQQSSVVNISRSSRVVGEPWPWSIILRTDQGPEDSKRVFFNQVDYGYFETMGIRISEGRTFSVANTSDPTRSIIINQSAADYLGLENPVGHQVHFFEQDGPRTIVGVVEDFNYTSLHEAVGPMVVVLPFIDLKRMYVRFKGGNLQDQIETLENGWEQVASGMPLEWRFLNDDLNRLYRSEEHLSAMFQGLSLLAIMLACLGLYGIMKFIINRRIKEIGVRKVLGASIRSLYDLLVRKYLYQVVIGLVIIVPITHYFMSSWLEEFAYHIQISWWIYPLSSLALILVILLSITYEVMRAARLNPTRLLRDE